MQWLAELSVKRNIFAAVVILILCVSGVYSYFQLGVDQFPNIDIPVVTITTNMNINSRRTRRLRSSFILCSFLPELVAKTIHC